jgi:hypothetical protein
MATRIGAFKSGSSQLVVWNDANRITFSFQKHYKNKKTGEWKESKTIFADELQGLAEMFQRASEWAKKLDCGKPLPKGFVALNTVVEAITNKIKERYETSSDV